jgi:methylphosphotriester-DNA--protein-cysteine methyltransferase
MTHTTYLSADHRWKAVENRDPVADRLFVYCVRTTKIFCRPVCKARLPRRSNVEFHCTPHEAKKAGFRACKRCKPELPSYMPEEQAVRKIQEFLAQPPDRREAGAVTLEDMARQTALSKWHFHRVFKKLTGLTPNQYARSQSALFDPTETTEIAECPDLLLDSSSCSSSGDHFSGIQLWNFGIPQSWDNVDLLDAQQVDWLQPHYDQSLLYGFPDLLHPLSPISSEEYWMGLLSNEIQATMPF